MQHTVPALEYEIIVSEQEFRRRADEARFDFGVIDGGYAWVFPKRSHLSVGILSMRRGRVELRAEIERYLMTIGICDVRSVERHGYTVPVAPRKGVLARGRLFLVGDAAGLADPVTAEGITHAALSGLLAAQAILTCTCISKAAAAYHASAEAQILSELRCARAFATILYRWPRLRNLGFRMSGQRLCEFMTDVVTGSKTYRDAIREPSNYLEAFGIGRR